MPAEFKDYYETLGVARDASQADVKKAFRKLARVHHPDVAKDKSTAEAKFKEINEAYEVLGDPEKRKKYDTLGANWNQPGGPPPGGGGFSGGQMPEGFEFEFGGTGFSDFFEQYFSGGGARRAAGFGGGHPGARGGSMRGQDIEGDLMVTLEESFSGSMRTISLRKADPRTGRVSTDEVQVRIPAGIGEGQRLRVPGHGGQGSGGGNTNWLEPDWRRMPAGIFMQEANEPEMKGSILDYKTIYGDRLTFDSDQKKTPTINGKPVDYAPPEVLESPFLQADYDRGVVTIQKGERKKVLDFSE